MWKRNLETWPHLVWKVPVQPLGLGQRGVRVPLAMTICRVAQLEAFCGQSELCANRNSQSPSSCWTKQGASNQATPFLSPLNL